MKLYVPLLNNGSGSVMQSFMKDFDAAFRGRNYLLDEASDSHANRGMNKIANAFLDSDCDVWLNIDADIRFRRCDVDALLEHAERGVPLVYGIYPKKEDATQPCLCTFDKVPETDPVTDLTEVRRSGRGFMLVKREVLEKMKEDNGGPALRYHNHGKVEWDFFPSGVVTGEFSALEPKNESGNRSSADFADSRRLNPDSGNLRKSGPRESADLKSFCGSPKFIDGFPISEVGPPLPGFLASKLDPDGFPIREWISEDWFFCERARKLGYPTLVDARIALGHVGQKTYWFGADQVTRLDSNIKSWRDIHGWFDYADLYHKLAALIPDGGRFVEVGCWLGKSIGAFFEFTEKLGKKIEVHVVDSFVGEPGNAVHEAILSAHNGSIEEHFRANMAALGIECLDYVCGTVDDGWDTKGGLMVHAKPSVEAAKEFGAASCDAIFIDGDHREEAVLADIRAWLPKVKSGGMLCGHDIDEPGVAAAVSEAFGKDFEIQGRCWWFNVPKLDGFWPARHDIEVELTNV